MIEQPGDGGESFSAPVKVADVSRLALGLRRGPRIVAGDGVLIITAISHDGGNLLSWRSIDNGESWHDAVQVNDRPRVAREGLHAMAISPEGAVFCTWLDLRNDGTEIFGSLSTDGGRTWGENHLVYRSPSGSVCECCHPAATYDPKGDLHVMWRNSLDGARDLYWASSTDDGKTFTKAQKLGEGTWPLDRCPMDGGWLAATGDGQLTTVWQRDKHVYRTDSVSEEETLLGPGIQPWVTATREGTVVVWLSSRPGDLWLATPDDSRPRRLAGGVTDPVVASPAFTAGPVVVVWESGRKRDTTVMAEVIDR